uniref:Calmodulin n=1 Tax=Pyrodinium bahamense TaxID=73915 RepID=A0A7S0FGU3_9DINO
MGAVTSAPHFNAAEFAGTFRGPLSCRYEILKQLGSGAQGAAYLVRMKEGGGEYVAKETHDMTPEGKEEFKLEFDKMRDMRHPNCTKVIELVEGKELIDGEWKEQLFVISELARGSDLYKYMRKALSGNATLTEEWIAGVYQQAMRGVAYIHSRGIVHNDLKPDNILMLEDFDPKNPNRVPSVVINDFGCATLSSDTFFKCGDLRYQSPESWRVIQQLMEGSAGEFQKLDAKADVWSMGATLFELLSGGLIPYIYRPCSMADISSSEELMFELRDNILEQDVQINPHCAGSSSEVQELLQQVFNKNPAERPSAAEVLIHSWFDIKGRPMDVSTQRKLEFKAMKGIAHTILLNALSAKVQRDHYQDCWRAFQEADRDQSGLIDMNEFKSACEKIGKNAPDAEVLFQQADIDGDQLVDFNEFMAMTFDWQSLNQVALVQSVRKLFADLDTDGTGEVDESELHSIFQGMLQPDELREAFQRMDVDGNGKISLKEMERFLLEPATKEDLECYAAKIAQPAEPGGSKQQSEAELLCGTILPAAVCLCLCWHGLVKLV